MHRSLARRLPVFSLRELLLLVAFFAVGCAALTFANEIWWMALATITGLACLTVGVVAVIDRGPRQAFAIGFILCAGLYYGLVASGWRPIGNSSTNDELDPYRARYPTSKLVSFFFEQVNHVTWIDGNTGKILPNYQPPASGGGFPAGGFSGGGFPTVIAQESHNRETYMRTGHALWMLLIGYAGGHFGRFVFLRRVARTTAPTEATP